MVVEIEKTILIGLVVLIIGFGTFFGSMGSSSSANDTNSTNITNSTDQTVSLMADPTPSVTGSNPSVSITVSSPVDLGTVIADGSEYVYPSIVTVDVNALEYIPPPPKTNDKLNLYVKSSGDLFSDSDSIPLDNLEYDGFSNSALSKTSFLTDYVQAKSWSFTKGNKVGNNFEMVVSDSVNANYYLTVPAGVAGETYTTTVYYLAIIQ